MPAWPLASCPLTRRLVCANAAGRQNREYARPLVGRAGDVPECQSIERHSDQPLRTVLNLVDLHEVSGPLVPAICVLMKRLAFVQDQIAAPKDTFSHFRGAGIFATRQDFGRRREAPGVISCVEFSPQPDVEVAANLPKRAPSRETNPGDLKIGFTPKL